MSGAEWAAHLPPAPPPLGRTVEAHFRLAQLVRERTRLTVEQASHVTRRKQDTIERTFAQLRTLGIVEPRRDGRGDAHYRLAADAGWAVGLVLEYDRVVALPFDLAYGAEEPEDAVEIRGDVEHDPDAALDACAEIISGILERPLDGELLGVGLACPFPVDRAGVCSTRAAAAWLGRRPIDEIRSRLAARLPPSEPVPAMTATSDASAGAFGCHLRRLQVGTEPDAASDTLIYARVAAGLGLGLVLDGRLALGGHGLAGAFGHTPFGSRDSIECVRCGRACLETVCSTGAIEREINRHSRRSVAMHALIDGYEALGPGSQGLARHEVWLAGRRLGSALAHVCATVDPSVVVLGGPLARSRGLALALQGAVQGVLAQRGLPLHEIDDAQRPAVAITQPEVSVPLPELRGAAGLALQRHADAWLWWKLERSVPALRRSPG